MRKQLRHDGFTPVRHALFPVAMAVLLLSGPARVSSRAQTATSDAVYRTIRQRMALDQSNFYLYLDQDAGQNHGFASGRFSSTPANLATIHVDPGCVDDPNGASGCSTNPAALDRTRGTVMRISFDPQTPGNFAGVNIEEPENWGVRQTGFGYDLQGATAIVVDVRSPDNATVRFAVGGCETAPMTIPAVWQTLTIPLASLSCAPNLADVHLLFTVSTSDALAPAGSTLLLDNLRFDPVPTSRMSLPVAFPLANQTFGVVPRTNAPIPPDQVLRNVTTVYESSLTALALFARGTAQDTADARQIADTLHYAVEHDNANRPLPMSPDGSSGLHNGYGSGDIALRNDQPPPGLGRRGDSRLPGFTAPALCPVGVCSLLDGATGGNNAFAILALVAAAERLHSELYMEDARTIGRWIVGALMDGSGTGRGGYFVGYPDQRAATPILAGKSTEHNADIFAALMALAGAEDRRGRAVDAASWTAAASVAGDFVMQMFDTATGRFNAGTVPGGTAASAGICPTGPQLGDDLVNTCDFLDDQTIPVLAMAGADLYRNRIDWTRPLRYAFEHFPQSVAAGGHVFQGFSIVPAPVAGANGVAWEFTAQMVAAMRYLDRLYRNTTFQSTANFYLGEVAQAQAAAPFGDGGGLVASTLQNGDTLPPLDQCLQTPFQCIAERVGLAASTWAAFAEQEVNVFLSTPLTPAIRVVAPNTPAAWAVGTLRQIAWTHNLGLYGAVDIELSRDDGASWEPIASAVRAGQPTLGSFQWIVTGPLTSNARIRVAGASESVSDTSDAPFAIVDPVVTVTSPNGAGMLLIGATQNVTFTHNLGVGQPIKLEVSADSGQTWGPVGTVITTAPVSGSFPWVVSGPPTAAARIRASWANSPTINDVSDQDFGIAGPTVVITSPIGAGNIQIGTMRSITLAHNLGTKQLINLEISRDSGATWSPIAATRTTSATSSTYAWLVSGPPTTHARVRASLADDPVVGDVSTVDFTLAGPTITVTSPNGAGTVFIGDQRFVTFTHNLGAGQSINLDISRDGGGTWTAIATVTTVSPASGTFTWVASGPATNEARVRASWATTPSVFDVSDVNFTLQEKP